MTLRTGVDHGMRAVSRTSTVQLSNQGNRIWGRDGAKTANGGLISAFGSAPNRPDETFSERQAANWGDMTTYFVLMRLPW